MKQFPDTTEEYYGGADHGYCGNRVVGTGTATMNAARNGRQIYCVVTDKYGNSVTTDTVTMK